jgi:uncharacterized protein YbjT (DUF2867 family)/uncharacterized protein YndB with AHSA1/START domain
VNVLVTGATGYIGGRLVPTLISRGHSVTVLVRDPHRLESKPWVHEVRVVCGDVHDPSTLRGAVEGIDTAYYLVHAMCTGSDFAERDRRGAENFVSAARKIGHVVYLGGILPAEGEGRHSKHLRSRAEVGEILRSGLPTTEIRAGPIIGSGSASFEMVRYLTERLPVMVAPRWITNLVQPIAVDDVLAYLVGVLARREALGIVDVGAEPLPFRDMMLGYAQLRGLPRVIIPVPVLAPGLAALWVGLVTPIPNCLAVPLVRGMVRPVVGEMTRSRNLFPEIKPTPYLEAVGKALENTRREDVQTRWSDALGRDESFRLEDSEGLVREVRTRLIAANREDVFRAFSSLGGERGWLVWEWAWEVRGFLDQLVGGPGLRRGRRHPSEIAAGEVVDFWRVEEIERPSLLRLRAEMKVPGQAWLQWETTDEGGKTRLIQAALFRPRGFFGWLYWYGAYPFHALIFDALIDAIADLAVKLARTVDPRPAAQHPTEP